ncbi:MAG: hypothetical protein A2W34_07515 [Chloroflexi bacterium RBG_16_64_32]|nr:MAG: hypothetical protein A2W34_07515 [Chloroflexi bacterium RBG_16_64_32]
MRWRLIAIAGVAVAVGLTVSVVLGVWTGTHTASGTVNTISDSPDLYLCEPESEGVGCGPDDSGADEIIFEGLENLLPVSYTSSNVRLRNIGATALDVLSVEPVLTEVADPGADCDFTPDVLIRVLGQVPYVSGFWWTVNDNHSVTFANATGLQSFARAIDDPRYSGSPGYGVAVHIAADDYEDFQVDVILPATAPDACEENVWDITVPWQVVSVGHGP